MSIDPPVALSELKRPWCEVAGEEGIRELMAHFGEFHDGCIREMHVETGHSVGQDLAMTCGWRTTVHVLVQRQRRHPSAIELRFEELVELTLCPPPSECASVISSATFLLHDGVYYWSEYHNWDPTLSRQEFPVIAAQRVWWRDASDWMGPALRYRVKEEV